MARDHNYHDALRENIELGERFIVLHPLSFLIDKRTMILAFGELDEAGLLSLWPAYCINQVTKQRRVNTLKIFTK